jgi:hypothetical protein
VGGNVLREQLLGRRDESLVKLDAGLGVELTVEAPHAVAIDPRAHPAGSPLAFQPGHPTVNFELADLGAELPTQLLGVQHLGTTRDPCALGRRARRAPRVHTTSAHRRPRRRDQLTPLPLTTRRPARAPGWSSRPVRPPDAPPSWRCDRPAPTSARPADRSLRDARRSARPARPAMPARERPTWPP